MIKEHKQRLKELAQAGAFMLLEEVIEEIKNNEEEVKFNANSRQLAYDMGMHDGIIKGLEILMGNLNSYAKE